MRACMPGQYQGIAVGDRQQTYAAQAEGTPATDRAAICRDQQGHDVGAADVDVEALDAERGGVLSFIGGALQGYRSGLIATACLQAPLAQGAACIAIQRAAGAHQHTQASTDCRADCIALRGRQGRKPTLVEHQQIKACQRGCIQRRRCIAQLKTTTYQHAGLYVGANIGGPALQVLQFWPGCAGQQAQGGRGDGAHAYRHRQLVQHLAALIEHTQGKQHVARIARTGAERDAASLVRRGDGDAMAGRIQQFHACAGQALHTGMHVEAGTRCQQGRRLQFHQATRRGVRQEAHRRQGRIAIACGQALADDHHVACARVLAQRGCQVRHRRCAAQCRCFWQAYNGLGRHGRQRCGIRAGAGYQQGAGMAGARRWLQGEIQQQGGEQLQHQQGSQSGRGRAWCQRKAQAAKQYGKHDQQQGQPGHHRAGSVGVPSASR